MKKALALIVALCLFCMSSAFAEYVQSDGTLLQLEDFALKLETGMLYTVNEKVPGNVYLTVLPFASSGDTASNFNFSPSESPGNITTEMVNTLNKTNKQEYIKLFEQLGFTINSFEFKDAEDFTIAGVPCVLSSYTADLTLENQSMILTGRQLYIGEKGYGVTFTSYSEENIQKMTELLDAMLIWN